MFLAIFIKKSFFFSVKKKKLAPVFLQKLAKQMKNHLPDEIRDQIGKSQEIWDWLVHPPQSGG